MLNCWWLPCLFTIHGTHIPHCTSEQGHAKIQIQTQNIRLRNLPKNIYNTQFALETFRDNLKVRASSIRLLCNGIDSIATLGLSPSLEVFQNFYLCSTVNQGQHSDWDLEMNENELGYGHSHLKNFEDPHGAGIHNLVWETLPWNECLMSEMSVMVNGIPP